MTTPITEIHNRMADYIPSTGQLLIAGKNGVSNSAGINMYWGAYEPRVGLTWKVLGSDKTVLRLGFGIYHDSSWNQGAQGLWQNPPNLGESDHIPCYFLSGLRLCNFVLRHHCPDATAESPRHCLRRLSSPPHAAKCGQLRRHVQLRADQLPARQSSPI